MGGKTNWSKVGRKSRTKGANFERQIAKNFTLWSKGKPKYKRNWGSVNQYLGIDRGDIIPDYSSAKEFSTHPMMVVVECKKVEGWELSKLLSGQCSMIQNHWKQALTETDYPTTSLFPIMVLSKNRHPPLCFFTIEFVQFYFGKKQPTPPYFTWNGSVYITTLQRFFQLFPYKTLESRYKRRTANGK